MFLGFWFVCRKDIGFINILVNRRDGVVKFFSIVYFGKGENSCLVGYVS